MDRENTQNTIPFNSSSNPNPQDSYSISKYEAEQVLSVISKNSSMEIIIIRCPLIYGPCVKANFLQLLRIVYKGIPLPLGSVNNKRSILFIDNSIALNINLELFSIKSIFFSIFNFFNAH